MAFYRSPEFKALNKEWRERLVDAGFEDIEDASERIKPMPHQNAERWDKEFTMNYYLKLSQFIQSDYPIPPKHLAVLKLHSEGAIRNEISKELKLSYQWVGDVLSLYRAILKAW